MHRNVLLNLYALSCLYFIFTALFLKELHNGLAQILKFLLGKVQPSEAMFFGPKRGVSLDEFLERIKECGLRFSIAENYGAEIWKRHKELLDGTGPWPSYQKDHCYPLLIKITV
ncbi:hypothetical protein C1H46_044847 [Malus baccata]|uniref:Uncharacterized protein n=1 Tax=Malus baccata TaxID=106549 RepID=A0A540K5X0_MALBA|nr:hypothetical protein C1H46_044847 [Malus baccata]